MAYFTSSSRGGLKISRLSRPGRDLRRLPSSTKPSSVARHFNPHIQAAHPSCTSKQGAAGYLFVELPFCDSNVSAILQRASIPPADARFFCGFLLCGQYLYQSLVEAVTLGVRFFFYALSGKLFCRVADRPTLESKPIKLHSGMQEGYFRAPEPQGAAASGQVILRDGTTATLRPARPTDEALLQEFLTRIAPESYQRRFFGETPPKVAAARMLAPEPPQTKLVLFVLTGEPRQPRLIATGEYGRETPDSERAEVAFLVDDTVHGKGLGTLILERLALVAARHGITRFTALTMARNRAMISMFQSSGFRINRRLEYGEVELDFSILPDEASVTRMELRERAATVASLYPFFRPRSVAIFDFRLHLKARRGGRWRICTQVGLRGHRTL